MADTIVDITFFIKLNYCKVVNLNAVVVIEEEKMIYYFSRYQNISWNNIYSIVLGDERR